MMFTCVKAFPGVTHITDAMGVSFTLVEGEDSALLFDAGYGTEDVAAYVRSLTDKPVELILSHGHHDHVLGARWFSRCLMDPHDREEYALRTAEAQRMAVRSQAEDKGLAVPADFLTAPVPQPESPAYSGELEGFPWCGFDLGNREVWLLNVPGHTAGSLMLAVPDAQLLLTGDDWNPCTWMWFPCSLPVRRWRGNMLRFISALEQETGAEILHVLCSHQPNPREASELKEFLAYMTDERISAAPAMDMKSPIRTHAVTRPDRDWVLLFDMEKSGC